MSIDANTHPVGLDEWNVDHDVCCNPTAARCGRIVTGEWTTEANATKDCPHCVALLGRPCRASFCRLRQLWRRWRGIRWSEEVQR